MTKWQWLQVELTASAERCAKDSLRREHEAWSLLTSMQNARIHWPRASMGSRSRPTWQSNLILPVWLLLLLILTAGSISFVLTQELARPVDQTSPMRFGSGSG